MELKHCLLCCPVPGLPKATQFGIYFSLARYITSSGAPYWGFEGPVMMEISKGKNRIKTHIAQFQQPRALNTVLQRWPFCRSLNTEKACLKAGSTGELRNVAFGKLDNLFQQRPASSWLEDAKFRKKLGSHPKKLFQPNFSQEAKILTFVFSTEKNFWLLFWRIGSTTVKKWRKLAPKKVLIKAFKKCFSARRRFRF